MKALDFLFKPHPLGESKSKRCQQYYYENQINVAYRVCMITIVTYAGLPPLSPWKVSC